MDILQDFNSLCDQCVFMQISFILTVVVTVASEIECEDHVVTLHVLGESSEGKCGVAGAVQTNEHVPFVSSTVEWDNISNHLFLVEKVSPRQRCIGIFHLAALLNGRFGRLHHHLIVV